ncbi:Deoxyribodipyrimidine photo-lyase [Hondaea fermentalgiana]|uniref:Deoxyribodipyrimidine photo-lyase n=1 Tax=Hondaea fermentalgiana TaxID=2315210 RepID=A0A2R5G628_9STRA|nr:Deoxyribodipyrimidine photo-lyase [Hondaea fermentalgiana]|eukprot:GBG26496.1 Deoxyribodipyrimidine photo-lyase [Hondaea fermentalgiana]
MSSYLNLGMVSPFRLARDIEALPPSDGKTKFADEFYKWRGISYNHAFYSPKPPHSHEALPAWALTTLRAHATDPRHEYTIEELERAQTDSRVWNEMQTFLEITGELHNNCRMFWGRAIIAWSRGPEDAMQKLVHLNDKFALDGLSPPSYAGLGWCLGLFDKPQGETAVFGKIRPKNVNTHKIKDKLSEFRRIAVKAVGSSEAVSSPRPSTSRQSRIESFFSPASAAKRRKLGTEDD